MKPSSNQRFTILIALVVAGTAPAAADVILDWNAVALEANVLDHDGPDTPGDQLSDTQGPPASARVLAIVHAAMFDAYNSVEGRYTPYLAWVEAPPGASREAAVARAAHDTLLALVPSGAPIYADALDETLARIPDPQRAVDGASVGAKVASAILAEREADADFLGGSYTPTGEAGFHDVDPQNPQQSFISPEFGSVAPFAVADIEAYRAPRPPSIRSRAYARALRQVKRLGEFRGGDSGDFAPTDDATYVVANYWSYNGSPGTGTPPRLYNQIARVIALDRDNDVHANARLFALINLAMADGGISAWDSKYAYEYWRPILGIRNADLDGNRRTRGDPDWVPLGGSRSNPFPGERNFTPPFPAYTSGHATFGAAAFKMLANFYQTDRIGFEFVSEEWNGETVDQFGRIRPVVRRSYRRLSQAAAENAASRVFNGVHWSYDGVEGVRAGNAIADEIFDHWLRPIEEDGAFSIADAPFERQIDRILRKASREARRRDRGDKGRW